MTKTQLKKTFANIAGVVINGRGKNWVIETEDESAKDAVFKILRPMGVAVGGYQCGHGGWVLTPDYTIDSLEYCDKASSAHY